jgi:4'-phosphopantetheinyl transferase EntD
MTESMAILEWRPFAGALCLLAPLAALPGHSAYAEEAVLAGIVNTRRRHQAFAVRALARQALQRLGAPAAGIARAHNGAPVWPEGWTGSLAHDARCAVALVGRSRDFRALGVDVEPAEPLPEDAASIALDAVERAALERLDGGFARWSRAAFGAKECVHKCINPLTGAWLEFDEVSLEFDDLRHRFVASPVSAKAATAARGLGGRFGSGAVWFAGGEVVAALGVVAD